MKCKIVDHDSDVTGGAVETNRRKAQCIAGGIQARNQALSRSLLITRCAIDLTRQIEPADGLMF